MFAIYQWGVETDRWGVFLILWEGDPQFTNEELKHNSPRISACVLSSSQFTNEELKQITKTKDFGHLRSSQFTNEELKLQVNRELSAPHIRFAIYQWGVETDKLSKNYGNHNWFAIYQWGVETSTIWSPVLVFLAVRNLPMRSWNCCILDVLQFICFCSQFTNEELKLLLPAKAYLFQK